jgi:hypothetical protein
VWRVAYLRVAVACVIALAVVLAVRAALPLLGARPSPATPQPAGFVIDRVTYVLNRQDPRRIALVRFRLLPAPNPAVPQRVQVKLVSTSSSFTPCRLYGNDRTSWECPVAGVTVRAADRLEVRVDQEAPALRRLYLPLIQKRGP